MNLNLYEKRMLQVFGCPIYHNTITRLKLLTALTVDAEEKSRLLDFVKKLDCEKAETEYAFLYEQSQTNDELQNERTIMMKLTKYEKETIVNFNEGENEASIYTFNADLKRRLAEFSKKYPAMCRMESSTTEGSVTYIMDKSRLSIRLVPPYSEERRAAASALAKEHGFQALPGGKDAA